MIKELTEGYIPKKVLYREKQAEKIRNTFDNFSKYGIANNLFILGVTGSGKTTIIRKIIEEKNNHIFISGAITKTSFKTLRALFDLKYQTNDRLLVEGIKKLLREPKVIIIDEVNKITDLSNLFNDLNTIYRETSCPIILISNKRTIIDEMPDDAKKTFFFDKVEFESYDSDELYGILADRIEDIRRQMDIKIDDLSLKYICALGAKEGSARLVLTLTLKCIMANVFSKGYIDEITHNLEKEDWKNFVDGLIGTEYTFLKVLLELYPQVKQISNSDILKNMGNLTPSRISQVITTFEGYGIIRTEYKNLGRREGRFRVIGFVSDEIYKRLDELVRI